MECGAVLHMTSSCDEMGHEVCGCVGLDDVTARRETHRVCVHGVTST